MKNRKQFLKVLNVCEGFKTVFKEQHWATKNSHQHELFDNCINAIDDFQDLFAEEGMTIHGDIVKGDIKAQKPDTASGLDALADLKSFVIAIMNHIDDANTDNHLSGMKNNCSEFLSSINKFILLGSME